MTPLETNPPQTGPKTVAELCEDPALFAGQIVEVEGVFRGWRVGDCRLPAAASPTLTRSDWLIQTGKDCLYVTGGKPEGLDPMNPGAIGRRVKIQAKVMQAPDHKVYLVYVGS